MLHLCFELQICEMKNTNLLFKEQIRNMWSTLVIQICFIKSIFGFTPNSNLYFK